MDGELRSASGIASQTDALAKLEAEACPFFGQVVMGRISLVPFFFRKRKTHAPASAEKSVMVGTASQ